MSDHTTEGTPERVTITEHAYAYLAGVDVVDGPTVRAGLARVLEALTSEHDLDGFEEAWRAEAMSALPDGWRLEGESITAPAGADASAGLPPGARLATATEPHAWHAVFDLEAGQAQVSTPWRALEGRPPVAELPIPTGDAAAALDAVDDALSRPVQGQSGHRAHWERTTPWGAAGPRGSAGLRRVAD
jgi:hypothetical protein